jgi:predicted nucleic acid-binding protein
MLLISDANILIDMEVGDLLEPMFRLKEKFAVPDVLYSEELENNHAHLPTLGLQILPLSDAGVESAMQLIGIYAEPSINDLFALELAREQGCPLLTGDKALREAAIQEGVGLRGTLWLVEQLVLHMIITKERAEQAYSKMRAEGRRLPWKDIERQIENWRVV